jgi:ISXO2-like transposase domain
VDSLDAAIAQVGLDERARGRLRHGEEPLRRFRRPGGDGGANAGVTVSTNSVEGYYGIFKRGMVGVYQHCGEQHLHRYLAEFDFRYSYGIKTGYDDQARAERALLGVKGKRLTYETTAMH